MSGWNIFYLCSILIALYTLYLFAFRTYEVWGGKKTGKRILFPNIIYLLVLVSSFIPIWNIILTVGFYLAVFIDDEDDFIVDSWLFKKPGQRKDEN
jgi:hypothetical protein